MLGDVNIGVARPCPSGPWQVAQPAPIMPPPIIPLPVRGMGFPLASTPAWKMASPLDTTDRPTERLEPRTTTAAAASTATASANATITRSVRRERAMLEVAESLQVLVAVDLAGGVA